MGASEWVAVGLFAFGLLFSVIGFLLSQSIKSLKDSIMTLFELHREDANKLENLSLRVATDHPTREVMREMFLDVKQHFDERFDSLEKLVGRG